MNNEQKQQVRTALLRYAATFATRTEAAASLTDIDADFITQIMGGCPARLTDQVWQHIARQVGFCEGGWVPAETSAFQLIRLLLNDARNCNTVTAIAMTKGTGKTFTTLQFLKEHTNCCYLQASETLNMRQLMVTLLQLYGTACGGTIPAMQQHLCQAVQQQGCKLLVIDNVQLLNERAMQLLLHTAGMLAGKCGIVLMGNGALHARLQQGINKALPVYTTFYALTACRLVSLSSINPEDIEMVCRANGLDIPELVERVKDECHGDLHRAQELIRELNGMGMAA